MSRFQRSHPEHPEQNISLPSINSSSETSLLTEEELHDLQNRLDYVKKEKMKFEIQLNSVQKQLLDCQNEAKKLGINTLEEFQKYVETLQDKDKKALETFLIDLEHEEELLEQIEQQLAQLEQNFE